MERTKVLETPIQSPADKKSYRSLQLENGLKVLLINDASGDGNFNFILLIYYCYILIREGFIFCFIIFKILIS